MTEVELKKQYAITRNLKFKEFVGAGLSSIAIIRSSALGEEYEYNANDKFVKSLQKKWLSSNSAYVRCKNDTNDYARRLHTNDQIKQLYIDYLKAYTTVNLRIESLLAYIDQQFQANPTEETLQTIRAISYNTTEVSQPTITTPLSTIGSGGSTSVDLSEIEAKIGDITTLTTNDTTSLTNAVNELVTIENNSVNELNTYKQQTDTQIKAVTDTGLAAITELSVLKVDVSNKADKSLLDTKVDEIDYDMLQQTLNALKNELVTTLVSYRLRLDALDGNNTYVTIPQISSSSLVTADDLQISGIAVNHITEITFDTISNATLVLDVPEAYKDIVSLNGFKVDIEPTEDMADTSFSFGVSAYDGTNYSFKNIIPVKIRKKDENLDKDTYYIIVVAGQSNAVGYDESPITAEEVSDMNANLLQLGYNTNNLELNELTPCADNFQNMSSFTNSSSLSGYTGTKGIHLPLAKQIKDNLKDPNAKIIIIPCAYGGTGFSTSANLTYDTTTMKVASGVSKWGSDSSFYRAIRDRLVKLLSDTTIDAHYLATIWCLGEQDGSTNNFDKWYSGFVAMTSMFKSEMSAYNSKSVTGSFDENTWFVYETTHYSFNAGSNPVVSQNIWHGYRNILGSTNYIHLPRTSDITNETNGTGSTSSTRALHFGNGAFRSTIAPKLADAIAYKYNDSTVFDVIPTKTIDENLVQLTFDNGGLYLPSNTTVADLWSCDNNIVKFNEVMEVYGWKEIKNHTLYFNKTDYSAIIFIPSQTGYWMTACLNGTNTTTGGNYSIVGLLDGALGKKVSIDWHNTGMQTVSNSTTAFTIYPLDVFVYLKTDANRNTLYRIKGTDYSVQTCFTYSGGEFTNYVGGGSTPTWGIAGKLTSAQQPFNSHQDITGTRICINPVGLKTAGVSTYFANIASPTNAEILALVEEYRKIDYGTYQLTGK